MMDELSVEKISLNITGDALHKICFNLNLAYYCCNENAFRMNFFFCHFIYSGNYYF